MKKLLYLGFISLLISCGQHEMKQEVVVPESSRFVREVFASNLYEPTELVVMPRGQVLFTQRRGGVKLYDPEQCKLLDYDSIPVFHEREDGLLGVELDPEFEQNNWIYFYFSPAGDKPVNRLSRFSFTAKGLTNEVVILEIPVQRDECCHTGGSIEFGADGLLFLSTGDNTNPFDSKGFSPSDERPSRASWDAQRSSANTNDLRGKILRIKPQPDGSYTIPEGNLFVDDDPLTRPEIYVMGCRNPYRISVDAKRGWLFWGDVGPDANDPDENRGPRGHDEFNVALKPGFFGWPLFVGDNYAYRNFDFATGKAAESFDPNHPINSSVNNTGQRELPPANPAKIYYPYASFDVFPQLKSGGRNAMAGPVYYSDMYESAGEFPEFLDGRVIYYDWMRGFIYFLELDENGNPVDWYHFMPEEEFNNAIDMTFGPDGSLFLIEYGTGWFTRNENARLSRIKYVRGNRPPVINVTQSKLLGKAPFKVDFDATSSFDPDGDSINFRWEVGKEVFTTAKINYEFEEGIFYPKLVLKDQKGSEVSKQFVVEVGNEPPVVSIDLEGNETFFWQGRSIVYNVSVKDAEDDLKGGVDPSKIEFDIVHYQSFDKSEQLGHQKAVVTGQTLMESLDCKGCHKLDGTSIGPSYISVAEKYQSDKNALTYLSKKIINGGGGVWGEQAMSAHPDLRNDEARQIVNYILGLGKEENVRPLSGTFRCEQHEGQYLFMSSYTDKGKSPLKPIKETKELWLKPLLMKGDGFDRSENVQARNGYLIFMPHKGWVSFDQIDLTGLSGIKLSVNNVRGASVKAKIGGENGQIINTATIEVSTKNVTIPFSYDGVTDLYLYFENDSENNSLLGISEFEFIPNPK